MKWLGGITDTWVWEALGDGGQESLVCCSPWGHKESGMTEWLNNNNMYKYESWTLEKAECWRIDAFLILVLQKSVQSPLDSKQIKSVNPKGNQPWIFIGRTDAEAPICWPLDVKSRLFGKDTDAGKIEVRRSGR